MARVRRITPGLIALGVPTYVALAGCLGAENAITILLAVAGFVIIKGYIKRRREFNRKYKQFIARLGKESPDQCYQPRR